MGILAVFYSNSGASPDESSTELLRPATTQIENMWPIGLQFIQLVIWSSYHVGSWWNDPSQIHRITSSKFISRICAAFLITFGVSIELINVHCTLFNVAY